MSSWLIKHVTYKSPEEEKKQPIDRWEGLYNWMTRSRLEKPWGDELYGFAAAFTGKRIIGETSYTLSYRGQGILSQVWTDPEFRGQGIARATIAEAIETFRKNGGRAIYLAAWEDWLRNIYKKVGFELAGKMGERHALKLTLNESGKDKNLFRPGQQSNFRPMEIADQTDLTSLFNARHSYVVKNYELGCFLGSHFEGEFYILRNQKFEGTAPEERKEKVGFRAVVLDGEETILGFGTVIPCSRRHEHHAAILDILVHQNYSDRMGEMLDRLEENCGLDHLTVFVEAGEEIKIRLLEPAGYKKLAGLEKQLKIGDEYFDLITYRKCF